MIIVILLLILAVLLFGSSAVLGAIGMVLGFIVAVGALTYASIAFDMGLGEIMLYGIAGFAVLIGALFLIAYIIDRFGNEVRKSMHDARNFLLYPPEERRQIEEEAKRNNEKNLSELKSHVRHEEDT